ncbi:MAG: hypothetical protein JRE23_04810 [Deltaproteobacteria bacterium]|nr:hypothetical protein [Deltaproteobacteria bacterium]
MLIVVVIRWSSIFILLLPLLSGCSILSSPNTFLKEDFTRYSIKRVAVLPFFNNTNVREAGEVVARAFVEGLFDSKNLQVEFPGNVRKLILSERIIIRKGIGNEHIKLIGKRLNVDAVIIGWVEKYSSGVKGQGAAIPLISINARMVHAESSSVLWIGQHMRRGDDYVTILDFGRINSVAALARKVVDELLETIP